MSTSDLSVIGSVVALDQFVQIPTEGIGSVGIAISGTWTGVLTPQVSVDGVSWSNTLAVRTNDGAILYSTIANDILQCNCSGSKFFRLLVTGAMTGKASIILDGSGNSAILSLANIAVPNFAGGQPANVIPLGAYNNVNDDVNHLTVSDDTGGLFVEVQGTVSVNGSRVSIFPAGAAGYAVFNNFGANATLNVLNESGHVLGVQCQNLNAALRYLQLHATATVPAGGAVPAFSIPVPATSTVRVGSDFFTTNGMTLANGIAFAFSTTSGTYTAGSAADQMTTILYGAP